MLYSYCKQCFVPEIIRQRDTEMDKGINIYLYIQHINVALNLKTKCLGF